MDWTGYRPLPLLLLLPLNRFCAILIYTFVHPQSHSGIYTILFSLFLLIASSNTVVICIIRYLANFHCRMKSEKHLLIYVNYNLLILI